MPAALVMTGRGAAAAHAGFKAHRVGQHQLLAADRRALGQRKQSSQHRRAGVQHHAAHVGVVKVEHVAHLAVGERRIEQSELELSPENRRDRLSGSFRKNAEQRCNGAVARSGQRAADPVEHAAPRLPLRSFSEVAKLRRREMAAQRLGQRHRVGLEVLVHVAGSIAVRSRRRG